MRVLTVVVVRRTGLLGGKEVRRWNEEVVNAGLTWAARAVRAEAREEMVEDVGQRYITMSKIIWEDLTVRKVLREIETVLWLLGRLRVLRRGLEGVLKESRKWNAMERRVGSTTGFIKISWELWEQALC